MKVVVFGASRGVGRQLVERALLKGYDVTAAIRTVGIIRDVNQRLRVVQCDVLDAERVSEAIAGQNAVLCAVGLSNRAPVTLYSTAARTIARGMAAHGVRRLVFLSNFGVLDETADDLRGRALLFLIKRVLRNTLADHRRALEEIRASVPEWIAVRALPLTNSPLTGHYRIALEGLPACGMSIARADVADFMVRQIESNDNLRQAPAIGY